MAKLTPGADILAAYKIREGEVKKDPKAQTTARADAFQNPGGNTTLPAGCGPTEAQFHAARTAAGKKMESKDIEPAQRYSTIWDRLGFGKRNS